MDKIIDDYENQFIISSIIKHIAEVYKKLDSDIGIENSGRYNAVLFMILFSRITRTFIKKPINVSFSLVTGDIVQENRVLKNRQWLVIQDFVVDLVNGYQHRDVLHSYFGMVSKLKTDYYTHIEKDLLSKEAIFNLMKEKVRLKNGEVTTLMRYYYGNFH